MQVSDRRLRVIVADDDAYVRRMLRDVLQDDGIVVIAEAADGRQAVELSLHYKPDVVLMDVVMPGRDGVEATRRIVDRLPETKVVILTAGQDPALVLVSLRAGAVGFLSKDVRPDALPRALRAARDGEAILSRRMTMDVVALACRLRDDGAGLRPVRSELTSREWEVLDLLCEDLRTADVAEQLFVSEETVRTHAKNIQRKLGVRTRDEAVQKARQMRNDLLVG